MEHFTKNTTKVMHWCSTCNRRTMHRVDFKRLGSCTEHQAADGLSKSQELRQKKLDDLRQNPAFDFSTDP